MRWPSPRMLRNRVIHSAWTGWGKDAAGGRRAVYAAPSAPLACSVQVDTAAESDDHKAEQVSTSYSVYFPAGAPAVRVRDTLAWVDGGNITLVVRSTGQDRAGRGRLFKVRAEHRAP